MLEPALLSALSPLGTRTYSDRLCDGFVFAFAAWTMICQGVVFAGGSLHQLLYVAAFCSAALLAGAWWWRRQARRSPQPQPPRPPSAASLPGLGEPLDTARKHLGVWIFAAAVLAVTLYALTGNLTAFWLIALVVLGLASTLGLRAEPGSVPPTRRPGWELMLWGLCVICAAVTLAAHRPDLDDSGYLHLVVTAVDRPELPLLARDSLHGIPELPPMMQIYSVQTLQMLEGALAYLTGLHGLDIAHWVVPCLAGLLVPLAYARLFRRLIPGRWIWGVVIVVLFFLGIADTPQSYSNFAFVRLHQGKAIFLSVLVPLLIVYGLEFALKPGRKRWICLMATQIAAVGMTPSALWIAPLVAGLAMVCGLDRRRRPLRTLLLGVSASLYVFLLALWMRLSIDGSLDNATEKASTDLMGESLHMILGQGWFLLFGLLVILAAWALAQTSIERRFLAVFPLGFLFLWNPFWGPLLAENVTHPSTYWRVFWVLPLPAMLAVTLSAPIETRRLRRVPLWGRAVLTLGMVVALFYGGASIRTLSSANGVRLGSPTWKVPREAFSVACAIAEQVPAGAPVLAPYDVSGWITTLHGHPLPLVARPQYINMVKGSMGADEVTRRLQLTRLVSGKFKPPDAAELMGEAVESYSLAAVSLARSVSTAEVRAALREAGLRRTAQSPRFEIWSRTDSVPERQDGNRRWKGCREAYSPSNPGLRE